MGGARFLHDPDDVRDLRMTESDMDPLDPDPFWLVSGTLDPVLGDQRRLGDRRGPRGDARVRPGPAGGDPVTGQEDVPVWTATIDQQTDVSRYVIFNCDGVRIWGGWLSTKSADALVAQIARGASPAPVGAIWVCQADDVGLPVNPCGPDSPHGPLCRWESPAPVAPVLPEGAPEGAVPSPWTEGAVICRAQDVRDGWEARGFMIGSFADPHHWPGTAIVEARPVPAPTVMVEVPVDVLERLARNEDTGADRDLAYSAVLKARESREGQQ